MSSRSRNSDLNFLESLPSVDSGRIHFLDTIANLSELDSNKSSDPTQGTDFTQFHAVVHGCSTFDDGFTNVTFGIDHEMLNMIESYVESNLRDGIVQNTMKIEYDPTSRRREFADFAKKIKDV